MKDKDVEDVYKAEKARGKASHKVDLEAIEERREIRKDVRELARLGDEDGFCQLLTRLGIERGSEKWSRSLREFWTVVREYEKRSRENP